MPIKFRCPSCNQNLGIARRKAGAIISCPRCSYPVTVPSEQAMSTSASTSTTVRSSSPAFERRDFERWIGVEAGREAPRPTPKEEPRPVPQATPAAVASAPRAAERPAAAVQVYQDPASIDVRLAIAIAVGLALIAFGGGFFLGRNSAFIKAPEITTSRTNETKANEANPEPVAKAPDPSLRLQGRVTYRVGSEDKPDVGSRVLAFPTKLKPIRRLSYHGLRPGEEESRDQTGADALKRIGGVVTTVGSNGDYVLELPKAGSYWVLILSKNQTKAGEIKLITEEQKLHDYFADVNSLLNQHHFAFAFRDAGKDSHGNPKPPSEFSPFFAQ